MTYYIRAMTYIESFDNLDDMFAGMDELTEAANDSLHPGQRRLRDADRTVYWAAPHADLDLVVYGETPVPEADLVENRKRGFLTGRAYSAWEERGEYGDTHVSQVVPIDHGTFELARSLGWPTFSMLREPENEHLGRALALAEHRSVNA